METREIKNLGHSGIDVKLNLMDQYEITHTVERVEQTVKELERARSYMRDNKMHTTIVDGEAMLEITIDDEVMRSIIEDMQHVLIFLRKLAFSDGAKATVFEEPIEQQEPVELLEK